MPTNLRTSSLIAAGTVLAAIVSVPVIAQPGDTQTSSVTLTSAQGNSVSGAHVYAVIPTMTRCAQAAGDSGPNGELSIPAYDRQLIIVPEHGATTFFGSDADGSTAKLPDRIRLAKPASLTLRLVDEHGKPIANAVVTLFPTTDKSRITGIVVGGDAPSLSPELKPRLTGRTDRMGTVTVGNLPQGGLVSVTVQREQDRGALALAGGITLAAAPVSPTVTIPIAGDRTIIGRVTYRATRKPVAGASVTLIGPGYHNWLGSARTDGSGRYRFTGLPPARYDLMMFNPADLHAISLKKGEFRYCAVQRSRMGEWRNPASAAGASVVNGKAARDVDFELVEMASVDGECAGKDGRPVANADVTAELPDGSGESHPADAHGRFHFRLPPGRVRFTWTTQPDKPARAGKTVILRAGDSRSVVLKE